MNDFPIVINELNWIGKEEGERFKAYQDIVGVWTIGMGHTKGVSKGMVSTHLQNLTWLSQDLREVHKELQGFLKVQIDAEMFYALVDLFYNLGFGHLAKSTLMALVNQAKFEEAKDEFEKWDHAGGKVVAGLLTRRLADKAEWIKGLEKLNATQKPN